MLALPAPVVTRALAYRAHVDRLKKPIAGDDALCALIDDAAGTATALRPLLLARRDEVFDKPDDATFGAAAQSLSRELPGVRVEVHAEGIVVERDVVALALMTDGPSRTLLNAAAPLVAFTPSWLRSGRV